LNFAIGRLHFAALLLPAVLAPLVVSVIAAASFAASAASAAEAADAARLPDGVYQVVRKADDAKSLEPLSDGEEIRIDDGKLLEPNVPLKQDPPQYIAVTKKSYVPIILNGEPIKNTDRVYKTRLLLQLAPEQIVPLEKFTRKNVGKQVAIVIGDRVVTVHKVREPIVGGRLQITRCTDNGCDVLFTELKNDLVGAEAVHAK
jgi:preprotein translocase subunit SecD